jgi:hypothetical protein
VGFTHRPSTPSGSGNMAALVNPTCTAQHSMAQRYRSRKCSHLINWEVRLGCTHRPSTPYGSGKVAALVKPTCTAQYPMTLPFVSLKHRHMYARLNFANQPEAAISWLKPLDPQTPYMTELQHTTTA